MAHKRITNPAVKSQILAQIEKLNYNPVWEIEIRRWRDTKTLPQLKTCHMWMKEAQEFFSETRGKYYTIDVLKDYFKGLLGITEVVETPAGPKSRLKSWADYSNEEMREFMDKMLNYCPAELGLFITLPNFED